MSKGKKEAPERVKLSAEDTAALKDRINTNNLTDHDKDIMLKLIVFNEWLQERLSRAKLTIKRLQKMFGFKTESRKKPKKSNESDDNKTDKTNDLENTGADPDPLTPEPEDADSKNNSAQPPIQWDQNKNHGRYGASDYTGCPEIDILIEDEEIKKGVCRNCIAYNTTGPLNKEPPKVVVLLNSDPIVSGFRYCLEQVRCSVCLTYYTAELPKALATQPKYAPSCIASIAIHHYYAGLPFKRLEMLQAAQGVPLADATQYDLVNRFYLSVVKTVFYTLQDVAAQGESIFFDDTPGRILAQTASNKQAVAKKDQSAIHTTALISEYNDHRIYLFKTNTLTAGKQFAELLTRRESASDFITMSDASTHNFPDLEEDLMAHWVISLCLCHGRRRFIELFDETDDDIKLVLDIIAQVYQNERYCKQHQLSDQQRLSYHQAHSQHLMDSLKTWFNNLLLFKEVEPNSRFGEAITYMLKRWHWLTQFLRVPGAALDNNICEQAIKVFIRYRKNSLFYRTFHGATMGDAMMSLLHTAVNCGANIFHYLTMLHTYSDEASASPENWLPWNYQEAIEDLAAPAVQAINSS